jgi:hypothetical protein
VIDGDQEYVRASEEKEKLNHESDRVMEWAKDAALLNCKESDVNSLADERNRNEASDSQEFDDTKFAYRRKLKKMGVKKRNWGIFQFLSRLCDN